MSAFDTSVFEPDAVPADTAAFNAQLAQLLAQGPALHEQEPAVTRAARREGGGAFGAPVYLDQAQERTIEFDGASVPVRVFVPPQLNGVYLHIHGGGWVLGSADGQDQRLWDTAVAANVAVVSVEYRLAPEYKYPAGPDDCETVACWLVEHAASEFGSDRLAIGGESAGGHLSAVTVVRMRDRHAYSGFRAANLVYGAYDLGMTPSQVAGKDKLIIPTPVMEWFYDHFLTDSSGDARDPDVSPIYSDLAGLPPALFSVGTQDPLLDDSLLMHQRWLAAGNRAQLAVYPGEVHGFNAFPTAAAEAANKRSNEFIRAAVVI